ncbi:hypothetical protein PGT21_033354 [Puccinia graminis f. sp. tritici]|uniref:Uncharacterized protein n=1 Tax=Puccinia graminis f. sp. tritici TaxID=56615 RepID=A0A5B0SJK0_PUCGR|nr:hypothetical protein PGT21_033354 [Puccinia graminis f. sp. tritici]KAA1138386.1 hypothetical protein PGTUg99_033737 [Puccinia graminis f. sp. tritici]
MMGNNRDILAQYSTQGSPTDNLMVDTYKMGIQNMKKMICKDRDLSKFKKHVHVQHHNNNSEATPDDIENPSADEASGSEDM